MDDWSADNPAGRLHTLLTKFNNEPNNTTIRAAWASVLGVPESDVLVALADVTRLAASLLEAVEQSGAHAALINSHRQTWEGAIFPSNHPFSADVRNVRVPAEAIAVLAATADHLHHVARDGVVPDASELENLKHRVDELLAEVRESDDLPNEVKRVVAARLVGVLRAIEHVEVGGPSAVRLATEAVVGALSVHEGQQWRSPIGKKLAVVLSTVWFAFGVPATVQNALPAWESVLQGELMPATAQGTSSASPGSTEAGS